MKQSVFWVEGNEVLGEHWKGLLEEVGYEVHWFKSGAQMLSGVNFQSPNLILIGSHLPDNLDMVLLKQLGKVREFPIMVMLAKRNTAETISALESGANDVVVKSLPIEELKARIDNLLRLFERIVNGNVVNITYEDLVIELKSRKVFRSGELIKLTPKEFELLLYLAKRMNTVCPRDKILQEVWGYEFLTNTNVVDVYIRHLRKKIDRGSVHKLIHTVRGSGYMLQ